MIKTFARVDGPIEAGTRVLGFFEADDEGPLDVDFHHRLVVSEVNGWPVADSPTKELHVDATGQLFWKETAALEELRAVKNSEINATRLLVNRSTFPYQGKQIACDELSRSDIDAVNGFLAITGTLPPLPGGGWKAVDNTYVSITTPGQWVAFYAAMVIQGSSNFDHAQSLKVRLAAAATAEDIAAIQWRQV